MYIDSSSKPNLSLWMQIAFITSQCNNYIVRHSGLKFSNPHFEGLKRMLLPIINMNHAPNKLGKTIILYYFSIKIYTTCCYWLYLISNIKHNYSGRGTTIIHWCNGMVCMTWQVKGGMANLLRLHIIRICLHTLLLTRSIPASRFQKKQQNKVCLHYQSMFIMLGILP